VTRITSTLRACANGRTFSRPARSCVAPEAVSFQTPQRAVDHLRNQGHHPASGDLAHLSPLGWEHINLSGDYHWDTSPTLGPDEFRPLRTHAHNFAAAA
jgi:hypothetical protein